MGVATPRVTLVKIKVATIINVCITILNPFKHVFLSYIHKIFGTRITLYFPLDALAILIFDQQDTDLRVSQPKIMVVTHFS